MKSWLLQCAFEIRHSYWFIPALMAVMAILMAAVMVGLDIYYLTEVPKGYEWLFRSQPDGARALLSTVAGSTITVAGVVFSMTIMSVSHATSNYGSRLLLQFLKDQRNQIALGTFISTFIYCLLVLRTVSSDNADYNGFVPHIAVLGALGMALASVAVLIMFIHHVPDTIHIANVAADRGKELVSRLHTLFPASNDSETDGLKAISLAVPTHLSKPVYCDRSGYIQTLDSKGLMRLCCSREMVVKLKKQPGDFVRKGEIIMEYESDQSGYDGSISNDLLSSVGIGRERTPAQDVRYLIEELSQISARALSPGINDPFTAVTCLDWLANAVTQIADREGRDPNLWDNNGVLRVILTPITFTDICEWTFTTNRPYVTKDRNASMQMSKILYNTLSCMRNQSHRDILIKHIELYKFETLTHSVDDQDRRAIRAHYDALHAQYNDSAIA